MANGNLASTTKQQKQLWLTLARIGWVLVVVTSFVALVAGVPVSYRAFLQVCNGDTCQTDQLTADGLAALTDAGLSIRFYALFQVGITLTFIVGFCLIAFIIAWRRWDDAFALFVSLALILFGVMSPSFLEPLGQVNAIWGVLLGIMGSLAWICFPQLFYLFPDGRFIPAWSWATGLIWVLVQLPYLLAVALNLFGYDYLWLTPFSPFDWPPALQLVLLTFLLGSCLFAQIYRYRRRSTPIQRQQTKWVVSGMAVAATVLILVIALEILYPAWTESGTVVDLLIDTATALLILLIPMAIGIAILRYRLWDIDLIIRRTLVYSLLTGLLALIYFGSVALFQRLFGLFWSGSNQPGVVVSTLAIAALFSPLRRRVQQVIDRRFYRRAYDAERMLARFGTLVRDEVELDPLLHHLIAVAEEAMQPSQVSVWIRYAEPLAALPQDERA